MVAYFDLELDTTPPDVSIEVPATATQVVPVLISIESTEEIEGVQEVEAIDSRGNRYGLILGRNGRRLEGTVDMRGWPPGQVRILAKVMDTVANQSPEHSAILTLASLSGLTRVKAIVAYRLALLASVFRDRVSPSSGVRVKIPSAEVRKIEHP